MTGPPTPPPTTATELQDEAKDKAPASAPTKHTDAPKEPQQQDQYQLVFPTIANLAAKGELQELIRVSEKTEINSDNDHQQTRLLVTAPLVLAYLILDDLPSARFALTRLPEDLLELPLPQILLMLLASTWERNHEKVYCRAQDLSSMLAQSDLPESLVSVILRLLDAFLESFRNRTFALLTKAYISIPLSLMQTYLGLPQDQLLATVQKHHWTYDASTQVLTPNNISSVADTRTDTEAKAPSSLTTFHLVASSVAKLEI